MLDNNDDNVNKNEDKVENTIKETPQKIEVSEEVTDKVEEAVEEIEKSMAEDAEKDSSKEDEKPTIDYETLTLEELVAELKKVLSSNPVQKNKSQVEGIKSSFNQKFGALLAEKKAAFLEKGGNAIDFQFSSPIKSEYNTLLSDYKKQRDSYYKNLEKQLSENLEHLPCTNNLKNCKTVGELLALYLKIGTMILGKPIIIM